MKTLPILLATLCAAFFVSSAASEEFPLAGDWEVCLADGTRATAALPGTLSDAGLGPEATQAVYGALTPRRLYVGKAVYTRTIDLPEGLSGDWEIFLERVMWQSALEWDGTALGSCDSLAAPHVYTVPERLLTPGRHTLVLAIDNALIHPIGEKSHCYSDAMQTRWNGALGRLLLHPANPLRKARVFAPFGDTLTVELPEGVAAEGCVEGVASETLEARPGRLVLRVPGAKPWSTFAPNLYTLVLSDGKHRHRIRFGFRTFETKGRQILQNGQPLFVRGNLDNCHFPLTGYPAMDAETWRAIFARLKAEGVNQVRCHTWCVPQAAFDAADELGLLISPEVVWIDSWMTRDTPYLKTLGHGPKEVDDFVRAELFRILDAYGNAPSFFSLSVGNELGQSDYALLGRWMQECKAHDPRHLYAASSARQISTGDDFLVTHNYPGVGMVRERRREGTDWDYEDVYSRTRLPTLAHEIGQWPVFPDFDRELSKYAGLLRPWNLELLRNACAAAGVLRFAPAFARASLMTSRLMYKDEIESFLRTPSCAGLQLLGVQDYSGQGEALIGWLDSFYDAKPGAERAVPVSVFFAPTVPLARFPKYIWTQRETFTVKLAVHHYGPDVLHTTLPWSFAGQCGAVAADLPPGSVRQVATLSIPLKDVPPGRHDLTFGDNRWPIWVFPDAISGEVPPGIVFTDSLSTAKAALAAGRKALFDAHACANPSKTLPSAFRPVYWSTTWFPGQRNVSLGLLVQDKSPAFAAFPTEEWQDWLWQHLVEGATAFRLDGAGEDFTPLAQPIVDFHKPALAALLFEAKVGNGAVLVSGIPLNGARPETRQLRRSLLDYVASEAFAPEATLPGPFFEALFAPDRAAPAPGRPEAYAKAVVYIECAARLARQNQDIPFAPKNDRAELTAGTYAFAGKGVRTWADRDGAYWVGEDARLVLSGATPVRGKLLLRFRDPNRNGRTAEGLFDGGRTFAIPPHAPGKNNPEGAYWLVLPVDMEDFLDGKLELNIRKTGGPNFMVDRIILMPNEM